MATVIGSTTTTQSGVTTTTPAKDITNYNKMSPAEANKLWKSRLETLSPDVKKSFTTFNSQQNFSSSNVAGYLTQLDKFLGSSDYQTKFGAPQDLSLEPLSTLTETAPVPEEILNPPAQTSGEEMVAPSEQTVPSLLGQEAEAPAPAEPTIAEVAKPEEKKQTEQLSTFVPTVSTALNTNPTSTLPTTTPTAPKVPTKSEQPGEMALQKRRGRASTIGLGKRSSGTELSSSVVKLIGA